MTTPEYAAPSPQDPKKKTWVRRHKFVTGVAGLAIVGGTIAATSGGEQAEAEAKASSSSAAKSSESESKKDEPLSVSSNKLNAPKDDVELGDVTVDDLGTPQVDLTITNHSSKTSDYMIDVEFLDANGKRIDTGTAVENAVAADQEVDTQAGGLEQAPSGTVTAKVLTVDRFATAGS
ncbi:FxLYD domain-containing protein [Streptomyces sp. NPDC059897]|uniref:FxLYD domain-containing protein n=1 Tax=Streptomyces sp. NPDC059897 TaxID=3346994 RepID=UPI00364E1619